MIDTIYLTRSKVRSKLLGFLFSNPTQKYYLSELARMVGTSAGNIQREMNRFIQDGLIHRERKGNLLFYIINTQHALFPEIQSMILKTVGIQGELQKLAHLSRGIRLALIYGSFARREATGESDIDLLIVTDSKLEKFYATISKLESRFRREINPTAYSSKELQEKIKRQDSFVTHVLQQPYILLKGNPREFQSVA